MVARKKDKRVSKEFKMLRLHREDLAAIEDVIKRELKPGSYQLATEAYEYDCLEDIPEDLEQTSDFVIQTFDPFVKLEFDSVLGTKLVAYIDGAKTLGVMHEIESILRAKEGKSSALRTREARSVVNFGYAKKPAFSKEPQSFLERNKDAIIVAAVFTVIAGVIALLIAIYS
ncbi:MAG: hypothetical protein MPL62_08415 [Alphaproteobacteria bacterium]|nr:hypothetical protein [Alphaproteobacteria bacterium]